jgi:dihydropteroate synthase
MGVLNVTPDSFSDGGDFSAPEQAAEHARKMVADGADWIDIGGESTRPGHSPVAVEDEWRRVAPVLEQLGRDFPAPISIDTQKAAVAERALKAGARIVNDIWGFQRDPGMARVAAEHGAAVVLMHNRDEADPALDILDAVKRFLSRSVEIALAAGLKEDQIVLDPGIGFGTTREQEMQLIARLGELKALGFPILLGASRKRFIGHILEREKAKDRVLGSVGAHLVGVCAGADIIRAHDIAEHRDALRVADAIRQSVA